MKNGHLMTRRELGDAILKLKDDFDLTMRQSPRLTAEERRSRWDALLVTLSKPLREYYWLNGDGVLTDVRVGR